MAKFCDDTEVSFCLKSIKHLDDIFMLEVSENFDLLPQILDVFLTLAMLHDELHGCDLSSELAATFVHLLVHPPVSTRSLRTSEARPAYRSTAKVYVQPWSPAGAIVLDPGLITLPKEPSPTKSMTW